MGEGDGGGGGAGTAEQLEVIVPVYPAPVYMHDVAAAVTDSQPEVGVGSAG